MGREVTPAVRGLCLAPPLPCCPRPTGATGCCSRYLDYLSSIYICICLSPPTRPPPCSSSSFPINARRPAAHNRAGLPRPKPLPLAGGTRQAPPPGGRSPELPRPPRPRPAPPLSGPLRPPSRPSPTDSGNPKGGKEGRNLTHTKEKWGRRVGTERHSKPGVGSEGLGERRKAGGTEGARRKMEGNEQDE